MNDPTRQVTVLSGKGGTGKTTVVASMACFANRPVIADCDVDASNLSLVLGGTVRSSCPFVGSLKAEIDAEKCIRCGKCEEHCHFLAISDFQVDPMACEGCAVCQLVCPAQAIILKEAISGDIFVRDTMYGTVVDAEMYPGEPNSGKLAAKVRTLALDEARLENSKLLLIDGPPGTGCPVISSITGADLVIIVTEPTASGWHDLSRVISLAEHFSIPCAVVINKYDLNPALAQELVDACEREGTVVLGTIPYDESVAEALINGLPLPVHSPSAPATAALGSIWSKMKSMLEALPSSKMIRIE